MSALAAAKPVPGCKEFQGAISAFVDGELTSLDHERVVRHLDACSECRRFSQMLRGLAQMHADAEGIDRVLDEFDPQQQFAALAHRLLADNLRGLAGICYELGKAYVLAGSGRTGAHLLRKRALSIPRLKSRGRLLSMETAKLAASAGVSSPIGLPRRRGLFDKPLAVGNRALETGRGYLEAALKIDRGYHEARLYLGYYFRTVGQTGMARQQLRHVLTLNPGADIRLMALIWLGLTYSSERRYRKCVECFAEVLKAASAVSDRKFKLSALMNLAIFTAKLERFDESIQYFGQLQKSFSRELDRVKKLLAEQSGFRDLLRTRASFHQDLRKRYPMLFAS
ncbi:MAG: zf-HC2 domain-containing protein [Planctomycetota bacterium]